MVKVSAAAASKTASSVKPASAAEAKFLRLAHEGGSKILSTVLGPEANDAHRTHLHWTFKSERRRFPNRSFATCASGMANIRYCHLADVNFLS